MARKGLDKSVVMKAAAELIEEQGLSRFSMGELARRLHVKTASLYNHVDSLDRLLDEVGLEAAARLTAEENAAISGKTGDEALFSLAEAYRRFAREHDQMYRLIIGFSRRSGEMQIREAREILEPIRKVLEGYGLSQTQQYHWQRILRGMMVGFAIHEHAGGFTGLPVDKDESYRLAVQCMADGLRRAGGGSE